MSHYGHRQWYEAYYCKPLGRKKGSKQAEDLMKNKSKRVEKKLKLRQTKAKVEQSLEEQFPNGRVLAAISSRPGQVGRADGYILEGAELQFYLKKIKSKKHK